MPRYKITIEYDGTQFCGWQSQEGLLTIQGAIEGAIFLLSNETVVLYGSGRTDKGVHALGQVAHFDLNRFFTERSVLGALNHYLTIKSLNIVITKVEIVSDDFHARFSTKKRSYLYKILNRPVNSPLNKNRVWMVYRNIDILSLYNESQFFIGTHDLSSFRASACQSKNPVKTIDSIDIKQENDFIYLTITAQSFLHNQIRIMVGTLVNIVTNNLNSSISTIIKEKNRSKAGITAPACGLYLYKILY